MLASCTFWRSTINQFSSKYRCVAPDVRGHGESTYNKKISSQNDYANDVILFAKALKIEKFTVMGWSMGGAIAQQLAINEPNMVTKLILHSAVGAQGYPLFDLDENGQPSERVTTWEGAYKNVIAIDVNRAATEKDRKTAIESESEFTYNGAKKLEGAQAEEVADQWGQCQSVFECFAWLNLHNISAENNGAVDGANTLAKIQCPVLVLHGKNDKTIDIDGANKTVAWLKEAGNKSVDYHTFDNCGHCVLHDHWDEYVKLVGEFLK
mmetsp:Transcript_131694/g.185802  ORF Transcript_131694/g.185802 Transcript_131694/m.185802 type:complete len:266 (-) Transcript_131694:90-887(-)